MPGAAWRGLARQLRALWQDGLRRSRQPISDQEIVRSTYLPVLIRVHTRLTIKFNQSIAASPERVTRSTAAACRARWAAYNLAMAVTNRMRACSMIASLPATPFQFFAIWAILVADITAVTPLIRWVNSIRALRTLPLWVDSTAAFAQARAWGVDPHEPCVSLASSRIRPHRGASSVDGRRSGP